MLLERLCKENFINMKDIPFLPYSAVKAMKIDILYEHTTSFLDAVNDHMKDAEISERIEKEKSDNLLFKLRKDLMKYVSRRYSYELWGGMRMLFE